MDEDSEEVTELQQLNVWGEQQEVLEKQALRELEIFAKENTQVDDLEEGELPDDSDSTADTKSGDKCVLDINHYIKRQEELRKRQEHLRSFQTSHNTASTSSSLRKSSCQDKVASEIDTSKTHNDVVTSNILNRRNLECFDSSVSKQSPSKKKTNNNKNECEVVDKDEESGSEYVPSDDEYLDSDHNKLEQKIKCVSRNPLVEKVRDDGCPKTYKKRLEEYYKILESQQKIENEFSDEEDDVELKDGLKISCKLWNKLYSYQQEGVEWLWKIHQEKCGGLLGDEMGLGKTVQIIVFLASLDRSHLISRHGKFMGLGPTLVVTPVTVIHQWVKHFHEWAPELRVAVLHQCGSYNGNKIHLIRDINKNNGILITTYTGILKYKGILNELCWHYVILDEGHKIRNSTAKVSVAVKQLQTPHRIMLTGSPMQNNLQELWSLFDFIVPGMLGSLPVFMEHFATPIMQGGYANSTHLQEATALSVATALKSMISPYLLRRSKNEVKHHISLPSKSEQVLFCSLTKEQRDLYKKYLLGDHVSAILGRSGKDWFTQNRARANILVAITALRKICNHPDIYLEETVINRFNSNDNEGAMEDQYGYYKKSGKMVVVSALLKIWKKQNHRVLLFTQARSMIIVFEEFLSQQGYNYLKMDGSTNITSRQPLIDKFNQDSSYDVFLLTTRVGGLGVNLTGANRVIIYDPDWNPATDTQARERAWRIGQEKQVTVYRLITAGTIEEKMYQRQVWKQLLSNKVLLDPRTQKFFKTSDLFDLFSLQEETSASNPETANIFRNSRVNLQEKINQKKSKHKAQDPETSSVQFTEEKIQAMKNLAQQIAKNIAAKPMSEPVSEKKDSYQKELEAERFQKLQERAQLKTLSPLELLALNRKKAECNRESLVNKIDDSDTKASFDKALRISEKTSKLYNDVKIKKRRISDCSSSSSQNANDIKLNTPVTDNKDMVNPTKSKHKKRKQKKNKEEKVKIDTSGIVDGEEVKGLVKTEIREKKKKCNSSLSETQDEYVLEKLFSKKGGVHSALQHDVIVQSGSSESNIKVHWEAQQRTDLALQALRKSRLETWRW